MDAPEMHYGRDGRVARRAETDTLLGTSIEGATEMHLALWLRMGRALGTGTFNIKVGR